MSTILQLQRDALDASFADQGVRADLHAELDAIDVIDVIGD